MFRIAFFAVLFGLSTFADGFPLQNCGGSLGNFTKVTISGCDNSMSKCILHKGTNTTIEIEFTTNEDATDLKAVVHGTIVVPIPFNLPHPDACEDPDSGISCPLTSGKSYRYKATLPIREAYPTVSVKIKWQLQDQDGKDIVCIKLPAKIQ